MKQMTENIQDFRRKLRRLEAEISLNLSGETECCGVTVAQCHLLLETEYLKNASLQSLADCLEVDKSTLSRTVDALVKSGFIRRDEDPENRRKVSISLTEAGAEKVDTINRLCDESYAVIFSCIPEDKHRQVMESVGLLAGAMKEIRTREGHSCCESK